MKHRYTQCFMSVTKVMWVYELFCEYMYAQNVLSSQNILSFCLRVPSILWLNKLVCECAKLDMEAVIIIIINLPQSGLTNNFLHDVQWSAQQLFSSHYTLSWWGIKVMWYRHYGITATTGVLIVDLKIMKKYSTTTLVTATGRPRS